MGVAATAGTIVGRLILQVLATMLLVLQVPEGTRRVIFGLIILAVTAAYTRITRGALRPTAMGDTTRHIGLDLGGTNIKWVVVERRRGRLAHARPGPGADRRLGGEATVVPQLAELAVEVRDGAGGPVASLGVAVPGLYIPESGVVTFLTNVPGDWSATPVGAPVAEASGLPTASSSTTPGPSASRSCASAPAGTCATFVGLTLGTGIGGVFAIDDQVVQGYRGQAGELGHQTIDPDGPWCGCGNRGCVEAYARADQVAIVCGTADPREAIEKARAGDERATGRAGRDRALPGHRHRQRRSPC